MNDHLYVQNRAARKSGWDGAPFRGEITTQDNVRLRYLVIMPDLRATERPTR